MPARKSRSTARRRGTPSKAAAARQPLEAKAAPADDRAGEWFERLVFDGPVFAVDMDQRVTRWSAGAEQLLGPAEDAMGRRCYEVLAAFDPRNSPRCRPNCAVVTAARHGAAYPDFDVHLPTRERIDRRGRVSIMLVRAEDAGEQSIIHMVRRTDGRTNCITCPGHLGAMLQVATRHMDGDGPGQDDGPRLTTRQRDILQMLAAGESPANIAQRLHLSNVTVRNHIQSAMERLGAHSRLEAVMIAANAGLL